MVASLFSLAWSSAVVLAIWVALDRLAPWLLSFLGRLLPDDIYGPGSWYVDTQHHSGIFDRQTRRSNV